MIGWAIYGPVYTGSFGDMGFCFGYGLSHAVHLATFDSANTFKYMIIHIIL